MFPRKQIGINLSLCPTKLPSKPAQNPKSQTAITFSLSLLVYKNIIIPFHPEKKWNEKNTLEKCEREN